MAGNSILMSMFKRGTVRWKAVCLVTIAALFIGIVAGDLLRLAPAAAGLPSYVPTPEVLVSGGMQADSILLKGIKADDDDPLAFEFLFSDASSPLSVSQQHREIEKNIRYFLTALAVSEENYWVNLSPYEADRMIPEALRETTLGRDLLAEDYLLKQLASSLTHPDTETGAEYWRRSGDREWGIGHRGKESCPIDHAPCPAECDAFSKIWIVPDKAEVFEAGTTAVINAASLKLECEEESQKILLPAVAKEVNEGGHFTSLRQIYHAMILATWFKKRLRAHIVAALYADTAQIGNLEDVDERVVGKLYAYYLKSVKNGVYDVIKKTGEPTSQRRRYFSGGFDGRKFSASALNIVPVTAGEKELVCLRSIWQRSA
jgi:hypothetical protein